MLFARNQYEEPNRRKPTNTISREERYYDFVKAQCSRESVWIWLITGISKPQSGSSDTVYKLRYKKLSVAHIFSIPSWKLLAPVRVVWSSIVEYNGSWS